MDIIQKYFPKLTKLQVEQFAQLEALYNDWNAKINVISRKDIQNLYEHHVLHSLGIAKVVNFKDGTTIMDLGTGGGFPGIPLAILFPNVQFHLVDRIGKKLRVAADVAQQAGLTNVTFQHGDIKEVKGAYDYVVSRAVMKLGEMVPLVRRLIAPQCHNALPNGLLCLKGGDLNAELRPFAKQALVDELERYFAEPYFSTKKIIYLPL